MEWVFFEGENEKLLFRREQELHRLSINPHSREFRRERVCAGEPSGFPCAFNKEEFQTFEESLKF